MAQMDMNNITGDPFALITISVAIIGWLVAFVSSIIVAIQHTFPNFAWWAVAFMFIIIIGVIFVFGSNTAHVYGIAVVGYVSAAFVFVVLSVNSLIYGKTSAEEAAGAGFILLCAVDALWIFYFGSAPFTGARRWIDSYSNKEYPAYGGASAVPRDKLPSHGGGHNVTAARYSMRPETTSTGNNHVLSTIGSNVNHGYSNSFAAAGTPNPLYASGNIGGGTPSSQRMAYGPNPGDGEDEDRITQRAGNNEEEEDIPVPTSYPYRAKAIYTYEANPEDANEIGFLKNEILEVSDVSGRWWQARKANGETGIAPSNYLILL